MHTRVGYSKPLWHAWCFWHVILRMFPLFEQCEHTLDLRSLVESPGR
jgi:hypothetical protein